ncbi:MAG: YihY/virulence factor BrkB family protein [Lachnospiraceae bacterium]|nr:YihY/virulence factor BrkB family protein [Lachnospiraceae bacterium]
MKEKLKRIITNTWKIFSQKEMTVYAGHTTLYIVMSFVPLLMLITSIVNLLPFFNTDDLSHFLLKILPDLDQIRDMILNLIRNISGQSRGLMLSVSAILSLWSASRGVAALQKAMARVYDIKNPLRSLITVILYTLLLLILVPALLVFHLLGDTIRDALIELIPDSGVLIGLIMRVSRLVTLGVTVFLVVLTYTFLSGRTKSLKSQLPGAIFTMLIGEGFSRGFAFFIPRFWKSASYYGPLASIFLVIMWLRTLMTILLLGASLNRALEEERAAREALALNAETEELLADYAEEDQP